jgi:hypothetical protein
MPSVSFGDMCRSEAQTLKDRGNFVQAAHKKTRAAIEDDLDALPSAEMDGIAMYIQDRKRKLNPDDADEKHVAQKWILMHVNCLKEIALKLGFSETWSSKATKESLMKVVVQLLMHVDPGSATHTRRFEKILEDSDARVKEVGMLVKLGGAQAIEAKLPLNAKGDIGIYGTDPTKVPINPPGMVELYKVPGNTSGHYDGVRYKCGEHDVEAPIPCADKVDVTWSMLCNYSLTKVSLHRPDGERVLKIGNMKNMKGQVPAMQFLVRKPGRPVVKHSRTGAMASGSTTAAGSTPQGSVAPSAAASVDNSEDEAPEGWGGVKREQPK